MQVGDIFVALGFKVQDKELKEFDGSVRNLSTNLLGSVAAFSAAAYAIDRFVESGISTANNLRHVGQMTGIATDDLQKFANAAHQADKTFSVENAIAGIANLRKNLYEITQGRGNNNAFGILGIDTTGKSPVDIINELAPKLAGMDRQRAADLLDQIGLGENYLSLLENIGREAGYVDRVGAPFVISEQDLQSLERAGDIIDTIKRDVKLIAAEATVVGFEGWEAAIQRAGVAIELLREKLDKDLKENGGRAYKEGSLVERLAYTGQGIADILSGKISPKDAALSIPRGIINGLAQGEAAANSNNVTNVTVNVNGVQDPQEMARVLQEEIQRTQKQRGNGTRN